MNRTIFWLKWALVCLSAGVLLAHVIGYVIVAWLLWNFLGR